MTYEEIIKKVSQQLNIPEDVVKYVYKAYWGIIKNKIETLPLKDNLTEEDFKQLKTFFNLPQLGKLTCTYQRYSGIKQKYKRLTNYDKNKKN